MNNDDIAKISSLLDTKLKPIKQDISDIKTDVSGLKKDVKDLKSSSKLTLDAVVNILDWTQDIHESIVMKKLPERVDALERTVHTS